MGLYSRSTSCTVQYSTYSTYIDSTTAINMARNKQTPRSKPQQAKAISPPPPKSSNLVKSKPLRSGKKAAAYKRGGSAAQRVYETLDIRCEILSLLDRMTLLAMLRVEKGGVRSVVPELYRSLPVGQIKKCTRKSVSQIWSVYMIIDRS